LGVCRGKKRTNIPSPIAGGDQKNWGCLEEKGEIQKVTPAFNKAEMVLLREPIRHAIESDREKPGGPGKNILGSPKESQRKARITPLL